MFSVVLIKPYTILYTYWYNSNLLYAYNSDLKTNPWCWEEHLNILKHQYDQKGSLL